MPGLIAVKSNVKAFLKRNFPTAAERAKRLSTAMRKLGRMYISRVQRKYLSGRPGLKRQTGHLARTWYHTVISPNRIDNMKLVIWTPTHYAQYHADTYTPKAEPRRFPPRLLVGAEWNALLAREGIADQFIGNAYMPTDKAGSELHYGMVSKTMTFLRRGPGGRFLSFRGSLRAPGNAWQITRNARGQFQNIRQVRGRKRS